MLLLTLGQAIFGLPHRAAGGPGILARILFVLGYSLLGAGVAVGATWTLAHPLIRGSRPLRWVVMSAWVGLSLVLLTIAFRQFDPHPIGAQLTRSSFVLSTALLAILVGGLFAFGLIFSAAGAERVYLSPAEFQALSETERARLQPVKE